jgi:hypothetical protein
MLAMPNLKSAQYKKPNVNYSSRRNGQPLSRVCGWKAPSAVQPGLNRKCEQVTVRDDRQRTHHLANLFHVHCAKGGVEGLGNSLEFLRDLCPKVLALDLAGDGLQLALELHVRVGGVLIADGVLGVYAGALDVSLLERLLRLALVGGRLLLRLGGLPGELLARELHLESDFLQRGRRGSARRGLWRRRRHWLLPEEAHDIGARRRGFGWVRMRGCGVRKQRVSWKASGCGAAAW